MNPDRTQAIMAEMAAAYGSGQKISLEEIPEHLRDRISAGATLESRRLVARAALPMQPRDLGTSLAILSRDEDAEVAESATESLGNLPKEMLEMLASDTEMPGCALDVFCHHFQRDWNLLQRIVANRSAHDDTVRWMARNLRGPILDIITSNQVRLVREPTIIGSLVANPATPTPLLARVIETAVRHEVDTSGIPGFKSLVDAFAADISQRTARAEAAADAQPAEAPVEGDEAPPADAHLPFDVEEVDPKTLDFSTYADDFDDMGLEETELELLLTHAIEDEDSEDSEEKRKPMWRRIGEMSLPEKVRLALMGDASARKLLVRDTSKIVSEAVMRSPLLQDKEVAGFILDKAVPGEIIRMIARNREYTKNYNVVLNLLHNPKCPAAKAVGFLRTLRRRDLQAIVRAKNIPSYITKAAKEIQNRRAN